MPVTESSLESWATHRQYQRIRPDIREALYRYAVDRVPLGGFLTALLANDMMQAAGRADDDNRRVLYEICILVYCELPADCHGSYEKVERWTAREQAVQP